MRTPEPAPRRRVVAPNAAHLCDNRRVSAARSVVVVGATIAGLMAAIDLRRRGFDVSLMSEHDTVEASTWVRGGRVDRNTEPLTLRRVFDEVLGAAGLVTADVATLEPEPLRARWFFPGGGVFDFGGAGDVLRERIRAFSGETDARAYDELLVRCAELHRAAFPRFFESRRPRAMDYVRALFRKGPVVLRELALGHSLREELRRRFADPLLVQMFEHYAQALGSDPRRVPATALALHHVDTLGTYRVRGGVGQLYRGLERAGTRLGVHYVYRAEGLRIVPADGHRGVAGVDSARGFREAAAVVVATDDPRATLGGYRASAVLPFARRSASAVLWSITGESTGRPLAGTNVLPSVNPDEELDDVFEDGELPYAPTITLTTPARGTFLLSVPAPARGELSTEDDTRKEALRKLEAHVMHRLHDAGIHLKIFGMKRDDPSTLLHRGAGGCMYGASFHGMFAPLHRLPTRAGSHEPGIYFAGVAAHPGPTLGMVAQSGRLAAQAVEEDLGG